MQQLYGVNISAFIWPFDRGVIEGCIRTEQVIELVFDQVMKLVFSNMYLDATSMSDTYIQGGAQVGLQLFMWKLI